MSKKPSGASMYEQMLTAQNAQRQRAQAGEEAAYSQRLEQERQQAAANAAAKKTSLEDDIRKKTGQPVRLGTLLTSPSGLLGNPILSGTKLSG